MVIYKETVFNFNYISQKLKTKNDREHEIKII